MSNPNSVTNLTRVARLLTSKKVVVRFRHPVLLGAKAQSYRSKRDGSYYIDLDPKLAGPELLKCFLHEVGHVEIGIPPSNWPHESSGSVKSPRVARTLAAQPEEDRADELARQWMLWGEQHAAKYGGSILDALVHYIPPELEAVVNRVTKKAIEDVLTRNGQKGK